MRKIKLLIVDPQNDFVDPNGNLYVTNAEKSILNLVNFIDKIGHKLDDIDITLDSHHLMHIANPLFWMNSKGEHPTHFTIIHKEEVKNGKWVPVIPSLREWGIKYVKTLEDNGRYELCIWPPHCLIGSPGANIFPDLFKSLMNWEQKHKAVANMTAKGSNIKTEHYSAVKADVEDPEDVMTMLNTKLIERIEDSTMSLFCGWASSHCNKFTITDMVDHFGNNSIKNVHILTDCMDPVKGFEQQAEEFLQDMKSRGANLVTTKELLRSGL